MTGHGKHNTSRAKFFTSLSLLIVGALALTTVAQPRLQAAPPPVVTGFANVSNFAVDPESFTADCRTTGNSTITYTVNGTASGTYPGAYTETGTFVIGQQNSPAPGNDRFGSLVSHTATFSITSATGTINGTFEGTAGNFFSSCSLSTPATINGQVNCTIAQLGAGISSEQYTADAAQEQAAATITTTDGSYAATGTGNVQLNRQKSTCTNGVVDNREFFRTFSLTVSGPIVVPPQPLPNTAGKATGGGKVGDTSFNVTAQGMDKGLKGNCAIISSTSRIDCKTVDSYNQSANRAIFSGDGTINGQPTRYTIDLTDNGEPGIGKDTFSITTTSGFSASGTLTQGNIQVHTQK